MMNIKRKIFAMLAASVLLASCSQDEVMTDTGPDGLVPVTLSAAVGDGVQTRIVSADEDDDLRYCYAQVCDETGETLEGYAQLIPLEKGDGGKYTGNIYLRPNKTYVFLFWADNSSMYTPSDLHNVLYQKGCIAFAGRVEQTISFKDPTVDATLQHVVSKVTLKTTTNVSEIEEIAVTVPTTYTTYNVNGYGSNTAFGGKMENEVFSPIQLPFNPVTGTPEGAEVFSFYALVDGTNQDLTLANGTNSQQVSNVPLGPNKHTTLVGDVRNLGLTDVTFTASVVGDWGSTETEIIGLEIADGGTTYIVSSPAALEAWATEVQNDASLNCTLADDITLPVVTDGGSNWTPIQGYAGTFDGNGKTITGLTINQSAKDNVGLFTSIAESGTVKNLTLDDVDITANSNVGAIAGENKGTIENCSVSGSVTGLSDNSFVGGIAGLHSEGTITDCHSSATVEGIRYVGGIAGQSGTIVGTITIIACYSTGSVTATKNNTTGYSFAGGVVGYNNGAVLIACYATGSVSGGGDFVGGVVGSNENGTLTACYHATGDVTGASGSTGGVVGRNFKDSMFDGGIITACYWGSNPNTGIGENQAGTGETTKVTDGNWTEAMKVMNEKLSGTGWQYVPGSGSIPLTLEKQ